MKIKIDYKILIIVCILALTKQIPIYLLFILFTFIHELGHIIVAKLLGQKIYLINILPIGCSVNLGINIDDYNIKVKKGRLINLKKFIIALAGPLTSILIAIIIMCINKNAVYLIYTNLLIGLFNLLPIYPLDGEQFLRNILKLFKGMKKANNIANIVSYTTLVILTVITSIIILKWHNIAIIVVILYLWYMKLFGR